MESKVIKKILSTLLVASAFGSAPCFVSADGNRKNELNAEIKSCDAIIKECNETIAHFKEQKDTELKSINTQIHNNSETIKLFKKFLSDGEISSNEYDTTSKDLEEQNEKLSQKIKSTEENYEKNIKLSLETLKFLNNKKSEIRRDLAKLIKKEEGENLIKQTEDFKKMCLNSKINKPFEDNVLKLASKINTAYKNNQLTTENIKTFKKDLENLKAEFNKFTNIQKASHEKVVLWKKINSGCQSYKPVKGNLCWLHSATNVLNYYNNIENKKLFKGSKAIVDQYITMISDKNIDGIFKEFNEISEYLSKFKLNMLQVMISITSKDKKIDLINMAKEQLKTHFKSSKNHSPVIINVGAGVNGHFVTIADYDENNDQLLIIDSSNSTSLPEAKVKWENSEKFLKKSIRKDFGDAYFIELDFTSKTSKSRSLSINIKNNNSIKQLDLNTVGPEISVSLEDLKNIIKNY